MRVLEDHQHGLWLANPASCGLELPAFSVCAAAGQVRVRIASSFGRDSMSANSAASCLVVEVCANSASSDRSLAACRRAPIRGTFHLTDDRIKGAVGVLRGAEIPQAGVRFAGEAFKKRVR